ncbi:hypothetical protein DE146DRAFT_375768 [Phaeosphaeria sp. MPI-PUGE-AT-0046c]|nr:hypothetical protein DE146DRAFT_375768 [Phaeosphaeria sp. MPI-PUGE-AT-0046c]
MMALLTSFPDELLLAILTEAAYVRSVKRALRLRLVCKRFANIATSAIYHSRILDTAVTDHTERAPEFWKDYLVYLALARNTQKNPRLRTLLRVAQYICRYRKADADGTETKSITDDELKECVSELCEMMVDPTGGADIIRNMVSLPQNNSTAENVLATATTDNSEENVEETALQFNRDLLSAAAWFGELSLAARLLKEGYNSCSGPWEFLKPARAASHRGHVEIVKLILADEAVRRPYKPASSYLIITYFNDHTEILDFVLGPLWQKCETELWDNETEDLQDRALNITGSPKTFKRLLEQAKPRDPRYRIYSDRYSKDRDPSVEQREYSWFSVRVDDAVRKGQTNLLRYLMEEDRVEDIDDRHLHDTSMFLSRHPVEFEAVLKSQDRAATHLSQAASRGDADAVKILMNAGTKSDHAIEFAAMCGSKTIVKALWDYGGYKDEAVQGALAMAVDREDVAMFNLLIQLGAKLDNDVRVALIQRAQEEGLESMVELLR